MNIATVQPPRGCTLAEYAEAKRLPLEFLQGLGLRDMPQSGRAAVRIPYLGVRGKAFRKHLSRSRMRNRVRLVPIRDAKDPSALHLSDPQAFSQRWQAAVGESVPFAEAQQREELVRRDEAWTACKELAESSAVLD